VSDRPPTLSRGATRLRRSSIEVLQELGIDPRELAKEVRAATPRWRDQMALIPIYVLLAGGFSAGAVKWNRAVTDTEVTRATADVARVAETRARQLEIEQLGTQREIASLRAAHEALRLEMQLRLGAPEKPTRKKGR
jgi:hypothetical protein